MDVIIPAEANVRNRSIGIVGRDQLGLCEVERDGFTASLVSKYEGTANMVSMRVATRLDT